MSKTLFDEGITLRWIIFSTGESVNVVLFLPQIMHWVSCTLGNLRAHHTRSAIHEPHPEKTIFTILVFPCQVRMFSLIFVIYIPTSFLKFTLHFCIWGNVWSWMDISKGFMQGSCGKWRQYIPGSSEESLKTLDILNNSILLLKYFNTEMFSSLR